MQNRSFFATLESYLDTVINILALAVSYVFVLFFDSYTDIIVPLVNPLTLAICFGNILVLSFTYHLFGIYRSTRYMKQFRSIPEILKVNSVYFGLAMLVTVFSTRESYLYFVMFWYLFWFFTSTAFLTFKRHIIKTVLRSLRKRQFHLRKVIIIGDNSQTAREYVRALNASTQVGMMVIGFVGDRMDEGEIGVDKLGGFQDLAEILDKYKPTDAVFAIDAYDKRRLIKLVRVHFVRTLGAFVKEHGCVLA